MKLLTASWLPLSVLALWEIFEPSLFFPRPSTIIRRLFEIFSLDWLEKNLWPTVSVLSQGYLAGLIVGIVLGVLASYVPEAYARLIPLIVFFRKMPAVARVPIVIAMFGIGIFSQVFAVGLSVSLMIALAVAKSVHQPTPQNIDLAKIFGFSRLQAISLIFIPSQLGELWAVAKAAVQTALLVTVFSETIGSASGIGAFTIRAKNLFDIELMWVGILVAGILSLVLHEILELIGKRLETSLAVRNLD